MRDVHDGLGGQLASIIAMTRMRETDAKKIEDSAEAALDDLRMVIGSLNVENDITGMLGTFRERAEQQLAVHDIELVWRMVDIPKIDGMNPSRALSILRIMQEATTNVVKHANADQMTISFTLEDDAARCLRIDMENNGNGFSASPGNGYGLDNMKSRADEIGGYLEIHQLASGARVSLRVPTKT